MKKVFNVNKTQKTLSLAVAMFAIVGMMGVFSNHEAFANPKTEDGNKIEGKKVFNWMLIGRPNSYDGGCGDGNRIFVDADSKRESIRVEDGEKWNVTQCNGTGNNQAVIESADAGSYTVYAVAKGKPGTGVKLSCDVDDPTSDDPDDKLCEITDFEIRKEGGKTQFKVVPTQLFDASLENIIWTVDVDGQVKIQFRVYENPVA
ncbi:MAG: hypothetical protein ACE5RT_03045 [Nitrosopumilaceae archaeon]